MTLSRWTIAVALTATAIVVLETSVIAQDVPSVAVRPTQQTPQGPNDGRWFVFELSPGQSASSSATVINAADVPQRVRLSVQDLAFSQSGTPQIVDGPQRDVGAWASVEDPEFTLGPGESRDIPFRLTAPPAAEPGDHIGVIVARTSNEQGDFTVERRVARRLYVTVPGEAVRSFVVENVKSQLDSVLWPSRTMTTVTLRNDGRIRLHPSVTVGSEQAEGSDVLLATSAEQYVAGHDVPWYGGVLRMPVRASAEGGLVREVSHSRFVVPWGLLVLITIGGSLVYAGRRWWVNRKSQTAELKQDIQRLEQLITQQAKAQQSTVGVGAGLPGADDVPDDEEAIILAALKRARRSDDDTALARIALAKHMTSGGGLDLILEALQKHDGKHRGALLDAAVSYGADALSTHERFAELSDDTQAELGERLVTAGEPVSGNGNGKPAKVPQPVVGQTDSDVLRTELAKVKGVGPAKQKALVSRFGSLDALRAADVEDLTEVPGIGYATARDILDQLDG